MPLYRLVNTVDPVAGSATVTATGFNLTAVVLPASKGTVEAFDIRLTEELIQGNLRFVIAASKGALFTPNGADILSYQGKYWLLMGCTPLDPDGSGPIIFKFGCTMTTLNDAQLAAIGGVTL